MTPEQVEQARSLYASGWSYNRIRLHFGVGYDTLRSRLDKGFAERVRSKRKARNWGANAQSTRAEVVGYSSRSKEDVEARLAEIPPDTRSPSAILLGDPIPNDPRRHWLRREA